VSELPEGSAVRTTSEDPDPLTDKWLRASFLVKDGYVAPILHVAELFPILRFRGSFQSDMEFEEAHYEFEASQGDITLLEVCRMVARHEIAHISQIRNLTVLLPETQELGPAPPRVQ